MSKYEGSYPLGFVLGFFFGLVGLIIAICACQFDTKRGALAGFITSIVIALIFVACYFAITMGYIFSSL